MVRFQAVEYTAGQFFLPSLLLLMLLTAHNMLFLCS